MKMKKLSRVAEIRLSLMGIVRTARGLRRVSTVRKNQHALASLVGIASSLLRSLSR